MDCFDGLDLQEAVDLKGCSAAIDGTIPLNSTMQFRVLIPFRTEADGVLVADGSDIRIKGWGGTFDFATLYFEHQLFGDGTSRDSFSYSAGFGARTRLLTTSTPDRYNHTGRSLHLGARYSKRLRRAEVIVDGEIRRYEKSDDLNPGDLRRDNFELFLLTFSWLMNSEGRHTPVIELHARKADNYTDVRIVPEYLVGVSSAMSLKFGAPIGLSSQAPGLGVMVELSWFPGR